MSKQQQTNYVRSIRSTTKNGSSIFRYHRISQKYLKTFAENEKVFRRQAVEIAKAMRANDVEPGALSAEKVLAMAGGAFGLAGIIEWCGIDEISRSEPEPLRFPLQ